MLKRIGLTLLGLLLAATLIVGAVVYFASRREPPRGVPGAPAEALLQKIERATAQDRLAASAALAFEFPLAGRRHFRDLRRRLVEVEYARGEDGYRVQYSEIDGRRRAWRNGQALAGAELDAEFHAARAYHTNDFFWLSPYSQLRAPGAVREAVAERSLLVHYASGGETPGDRYLIITDAAGQPERIQMWVSVIPIPGAEFRVERWETTATGARFATLYSSAARNVELTNVRAYAAYPEPGVRDRFELDFENNPGQ